MMPRWLRSLLSSRTGLFGVIVVLLIAVTALVSVFWTPFDPMLSDIRGRWAAPGWPHLLGTDGTGRDILSLVMAGARTTLLTGDAIAFANFEPGAVEVDPRVDAFIAALRSADGVIIGSPGYHGTFSGMVKNALDHVEMMSGDARPYFHGLPIGLIATAAGWQAAVSGRRSQVGA